MTAVILAITGLLLLLTRVTGVRQMMLAVMLVRPSCDRVFDWAKAAFGQQSGPGAAVNALVIATAIIAIVNVPEIAVSAPLLAWASFLLTAAASLFYTPDPGGGVRALLALVTYAATFALPYAVVKSGRTAAQCLAVALSSSVVPSTVALFELAMRPTILTGEERLQSTFTHPNIYAFYIVSLVTIIFYLHCSATIKLSAFMRRTTFAYAGYLLFLLALTKTRSAWLAMLLIMAGHAILVDRRWLIPTLSLPLALLIPGVGERFADLESGRIDAGFEHLNSLAWRQVLWDNTLEWLTANPSGILGYGLGSYQSYVPLFFPRGEGQLGVGPHNAFLQIYFEMGIAGATSAALLMTSIAFKFISALGRDTAGSFTMLMMCSGYLIMCYSDNLLDYLQFQWFFWFTIGTVCASTRFADHAAHVRPALA